MPSCSSNDATRLMPRVVIVVVTLFSEDHKDPVCQSGTATSLEFSTSNKMFVWERPSVIELLGMFGMKLKVSGQIRQYMSHSKQDVFLY